MKSLVFRGLPASGQENPFWTSLTIKIPGTDYDRITLFHSYTSQNNVSGASECLEASRGRLNRSIQFHSRQSLDFTKRSSIRCMTLYEHFGPTLTSQIDLQETTHKTRMQSHKIPTPCDTKVEAARSA